VLVDSHCHLGDRAFADDRAEVVSRAWDAGVSRLVIIGETRAATELGRTMAREDSRIGFTAGVHPHDAREWSDDTADWLRSVAPDPGMVALGEIGLDYHYDHSPRAAQQQVFERQLSLALELGLPVVIHAREADDDIAAILRNHPAVPAVMHSFSSGLGLWRTALDLGHCISFSGMVTFKNWTLDEAVRATPDDRLLLETDAPYLAPVPRRGKRNEPAFVRHVVERVADIRRQPVEQVIEHTGANAARLFGWEETPGNA
jgi:TatD DNase family protein